MSSLLRFFSVHSICLWRFPEITKFLGVSVKYTQDIKNFLMQCIPGIWLSKTFYIIQISLIDPKKYYFSALR